MNKKTQFIIIGILATVIVAFIVFLVIQNRAGDNKDSQNDAATPLTEDQINTLLTEMATTSPRSYSEEEMILESLRATSSYEYTPEQREEINRILDSLKAPR